MIYLASYNLRHQREIINQLLGKLSIKLVVAYNYKPNSN